MSMSFAEVVRFHRKRLRLTQEQLAEKMGLAYSRISKVEQGHTFRRLPDAEEFRAWAEGLEVSPTQMLKQMGYIVEEAIGDQPKHPDVIFTALSTQVYSSDSLPPDVRQVILDSIKHAQWLHDALSKQESNTKTTTALQGVLLPAFREN